MAGRAWVCWDPEEFISEKEARVSTRDHSYILVFEDVGKKGAWSWNHEPLRFTYFGDDVGRGTSQRSTAAFLTYMKNDPPWEVKELNSDTDT